MERDNEEMKPLAMDTAYTIPQQILVDAALNQHPEYKDDLNKLRDTIQTHIFMIATNEKINHEKIPTLSVEDIILIPQCRKQFLRLIEMNMKDEY